MNLPVEVMVTETAIWSPTAKVLLVGGLTPLMPTANEAVDWLKTALSTVEGAMSTYGSVIVELNPVVFGLYAF